MKKLSKILTLVLCAALLVTASVMGTLAYLNAVADPVKRAKVAAKFPPNTTYDMRQRVWDRENHESGLIGPVRLIPQVFGAVGE